MASELVLSACIAAGGATAVAVAFSFPTLTASGTGSIPGISEANYEAIRIEEAAFCQGLSSSHNCTCFSHTSGLIQAYRAPEVRGFAYANRQTLARSQARSRC